MDPKAEDSLQWLVTWANQIEREVQYLTGAVENHRAELEELRSAAAGLRMQAEALQGQLTLKPEPAQAITPYIQAMHDLQLPESTEDIEESGEARKAVIDGLLAKKPATVVEVKSSWTGVDLKHPEQWPPLKDDGKCPLDQAGEVILLPAANGTSREDIPAPECDPAGAVGNEPQAGKDSSSPREGPKGAGPIKDTASKVHKSKGGKRESKSDTGR